VIALLRDGLIYRRYRRHQLDGHSQCELLVALHHHAVVRENETRLVRAASRATRFLMGGICSLTRRHTGSSKVTDGPFPQASLRPAWERTASVKAIDGDTKGGVARGWTILQADCYQRLPTVTGLPPCKPTSAKAIDTTARKIQPAP
jgi:hypothetical protein